MRSLALTLQHRPAPGRKAAAAADTASTGSRWSRAAAALAAGLVTLLTLGCATPKQITTDAVSFGSWPPDRKPGTYAFERLPSQKEQKASTAQDRVEAAAAVALEQAGFKAAPAADAEVLVTASARYIIVPFGNYVGGWGPPPYIRTTIYYGHGYAWRRHYPFHRGYYRGFYGFYGPYGGYGTWGATSRVLETSLILRDRKTQQVVHEASARYDYPWSDDPVLFQALFDAALQGFPEPASRRRVTVAVPRSDGSAPSLDKELEKDQGGDDDAPADARPGAAPAAPAAPASAPS